MLGKSVAAALLTRLHSLGQLGDWRRRRQLCFFVGSMPSLRRAFTCTLCLAAPKFKKFSPSCSHEHAPHGSESITTLSDVLESNQSRGREQNGRSETGTVLASGKLPRNIWVISFYDMQNSHIRQSLIEVSRNSEVLINVAWWPRQPHNLVGSLLDQLQLRMPTFLCKC